MSKVTWENEIKIIYGRARGQTYDRLRETTGHSNSTISRVLKQEYLCQRVMALYYDNEMLREDVVFYKKWLTIAMIVWGLAITIQSIFLFIF